MQHTASHRNFFWLLLLGLLLARIAFTTAYPLLVEGDGSYYFEMMLTPKSNLLHAPGYPILFAPLVILIKLTGLPIGETLHAIQQLFTMGCALVLYTALARLIPPLLAFLASATYGMDFVTLTAAATTRPEFFQSGLIVLIASAAIYQARVKKPSHLYLWSIVLGGLMASAYITKFNSLSCFLFCLMPLCNFSFSLFRRILSIICSLGICIASIALFIICVHQPQTGTHKLNLEKGWIYSQKIDYAGIPFTGANGINNMKYQILAQGLPQIPFPGQALWDNVNAREPHLRQPFLDQYSTVINSEDKQLITELYKTAGEPQGIADQFPRLYHAIGLQQTEDIIFGAFLESIISYPQLYLKHAWKVFLDGLNYNNHHQPYLVGFETKAPFSPTYNDKQSAIIKLKDNRFDEEARKSQRYPVSQLQPSWPDLKTFGPDQFDRRYVIGLQYFGLMQRAIHPNILLLVTALCAFALILKLTKHRSFNVLEYFWLLALLSFLGALTLTGLVYVFRLKEFILLKPIVIILFYSSLGLLTPFLRTLPSGIRGRLRLQRRDPFKRPTEEIHC